MGWDCKTAAPGPPAHPVMVFECASPPGWKGLTPTEHKTQIPQRVFPHSMRKHKRKPNHMPHREASGRGALHEEIGLKVQRRSSFALEQG
jgi:hypothetical protein